MVDFRYIIVNTLHKYDNKDDDDNNNNNNNNSNIKGKVIPQQAEVAQGVPGRLRPRIFLTFGTTRVIGRQPNAPAAFTPGEIPGTHFQRQSRTQGT